MYLAIRFGGTFVFPFSLALQDTPRERWCWLDKAQCLTIVVIIRSTNHVTLNSYICFCHGHPTVISHDIAGILSYLPRPCARGNEHPQHPEYVIGTLARSCRDLRRRRGWCQRIGTRVPLVYVWQVQLTSHLPTASPASCLFQDRR